MRIHAPRCFNYCLSNTDTCLFKKNPVICHVSVSVPIFSQHLESVLRTLTFICSAFVSVGKHRIEENPSKKKNLYLSEPLCGYFIEGDGMREMFEESQTEKHGFQSDHYQIEG